MYFKSSYTVLVNTGQAHSASNLFAEMQKYFVAARGVFPAAKAFPRLHILLPILNNNNLLLSVLPFTSSAFQAAVNASVLTAQLGKPRHISAGGFPCHLWLWDFVYCHMHQVLAQVLPSLFLMELTPVDIRGSIIQHKVLHLSLPLVSFLIFRTIERKHYRMLVTLVSVKFLWIDCVRSFKKYCRQ